MDVHARVDTGPRAPRATAREGKERTDAVGMLRDSNELCVISVVSAQLARSSTPPGTRRRDHSGAVCIVNQAREEEAGMKTHPALPRGWLIRRSYSIN